MATLNGRVARLEAASAKTIGPDDCRTCGLRHVRPLTLELVRGLIRIVGSSQSFPQTAPLCLCDCCTADPGDRWFARLSHGLPADEGAA